MSDMLYQTRSTCRNGEHIPCYDSRRSTFESEVPDTSTCPIDESHFDIQPEEDNRKSQHMIVFVGGLSIQTC